jgi:hypothetical protein
MRIRRELRNFFIGSLLGLMAVLLLLFNALLLWVATGPRTLDRLTPVIESALNATDGSYTVDIGETWLLWDGWAHPIDIRLRHVKVLSREKQVFSTFPEISLDIDILSLPLGRILPTSITIDNPVISLYQNEDRSISFGFGEKTNEPVQYAPTMSSAALFGPLMYSEDFSRMRKLKEIVIRNADVSVGNIGKGVFFSLSKVGIEARRVRRDTMELAATAEMHYEERISTLATRITMGRSTPTIDGTIEFTQITPGILTSLFVENPVIGGINIPVSGVADISIAKDGVLNRLGFKIEGQKGSIATEHLSGVLPVNGIKAAGSLRNNGNDIHIDALDLDVEGTKISGAGMVLLKDGDISVKANLSLADGKAEQVALFWPPALSPMSREWVTSNISGGKIPQAAVHVNIPFGDMAKPALPKEDIDASIAIEGATVKYLPEHPQVTNVKGIIHIDGVSLKAQIESADYLKESKLTGGVLAIDDLNADNPYITLEFDASASARDAVHVLGLPRLEHAKHLNLNAEEAKGSGTARVKLGFHFFTPTGPDGKPIDDDISYDVSAKLNGVSQDQFMNKFDVTNATGELTVNMKSLTFKGGGTVNTASVAQAEVTYLFEPEGGFDTLIDVQATAPVEALPRFGYPLLPFLKGAIGVKGKVKLGNNAESSAVTIDLTDATVVNKTISLNKPDKEPATLELAAEKKNGVVTIPKFHLTGKDINASGSMALNKELTDIEEVTSEHFIVGKNNLEQLHYKTTAEGFELTAKGKSADAGGFVYGEGESTFSFAKFPAVVIDADVGTLALAGDTQISKFKGTLNCDIKICHSADFSGFTGEGKDFAVKILHNPKGIRQFSLHAKDAGQFLKAIDAIGGMQGGELIITGNYAEVAGVPVLRGRVVISEHTIKDAPVLAKILSLASLTGFIDALQGNGIRFHKLAAPFTLYKDVLTLENAKTAGEAIGLTAEGTITFPQKTVDIQGTVVPANMLNSAVGKVPIVGQILAGSDGQGVFAARYKVKGTTANPDVSVNPLSMLTPGFLRNIFDTKEPDNDAKQ